MYRTGFLRTVVVLLFSIMALGGPYACGHGFRSDNNASPKKSMLVALGFESAQPALVRTDRMGNGGRTGDLKILTRPFCTAVQYVPARGSAGHVDIGISISGISSANSHTLVSLHCLLVV
jgi:hypothetical protein